MLVLTVFRRAWLLNGVLRKLRSSKRMIVKADTTAGLSIDASFDPIRW